MSTEIPLKNCSVIVSSDGIVTLKDTTFAKKTVLATGTLLENGKIKERAYLKNMLFCYL